MFSPREILEIAVRIEENGYAFYRFAAQNIDNQEAELLFNYLADAEINHKKVFTGLLSETVDSGPQWENHPGEHLAYLNAFAENLVFGKELKDKKNFVITGTEEVLQFAMQREMESILFYHEMKAYLPQAKQPILDAIIAEERKHFISLSNLKKSF